MLDGLARGQADRPIRQAAPILLDALPRLLAAQPDGPLGLRNRAMLLIGYGAALRRSSAQLEADVARTTAEVRRPTS
ncbi:hypothetical protein [Azospirillum brasilense]|uniref:hypothetical protein n=1 Tax=Azospirillum brasilense TaxID=192 RepID=UPI0003A71F31|nr:hypothetical protein [Azospirillum brasilense]